MANGIVYILNDKNEIVHEFKCDYDVAVKSYFGKRDYRGRFYISVEGKSVPFKRKRKALKDVRPSSQKT